MLTVSDTAKNKIHQQLKKRGKGIGIQIGIKTTGCSGLAYTIEYVDHIIDSNNFNIFHINEAIIIIDKKHLPYLNGLHVDYKKQGLNEGFEFSNPNERDKCGCGESFRV